MATKRTDKKYVSVAKTVSIKCTSRASIKVGDSFYTLEYCEERMISDNADVEKERAILWDVVNNECDLQIQDVLKTFKK